MTKTRALLTLVVTVAVLVGGAVLVRSTSAAPTVTATPTVRPAVGVASTRYGRILVDGRGFALYAFTRDARGKSACYGDCAAKWPPFLVARRPASGRGTKSSLVGVTKRSGGKLQATYGGRPLYYYVGDSKPGIVLCQGVDEFGGTWLVLQGSGALVR